MINLGLFALGANVAGAEDFILKAEDLSTSSSIKWTEIDSSQYDPNDKNMIKVDLSSGKSQYFAYTYTKPEGGTVYDTRQEGKDGALTGDVTADFIGISSTVNGGALNNTANNDLIIRGNFINNETTGRLGGAVQNNGRITIIGDYINNVVHGYGGALRNDGSVGSITGNFIGNKGIKHNGPACGGALYFNQPNAPKMDSITGYFINNYLENTMDDDVANDPDKADTVYSKGGALDFFTFSVGKITGVFINNTINAQGFGYGSAINAGNTQIDEIKGIFINNIAKGNRQAGAALYFYSKDNGTMKVGSIEADFYNNGSYSANGAALGGALYAADHVEIGSIIGNFTNNYAQSEAGLAIGGAIYNNSNSSIGSITGNFSNNYAQSEASSAEGGVIYNNPNSSIGSIIGNFTNNFTKSQRDNSSYYGATGGAIYNVSSTIGNILGNFAGNYAENSVGKSSSAGGAIYNRDSAKIGNIQGNFENNYALSEDTIAQGGAIYNSNSASIDNITGNFSNNSANSQNGITQGGAIYNYASSIDNIIGNFSNNSTKSKNGITGGGTISNFSSSISYIQSNFDKNYAISEKSSAYGGVIYNNNSTIDNIIGDFTNNFAQGNNNNASQIGAAGGAIYNYNSTIGDITGNFVNNYAKNTVGTSGVDGGAIFNSYSAKIGNIKGNFENNHIYSKNGSTYGGGISGAKSAAIKNIVGNFTNNYAKSESNSADGGAIALLISAKINSITGDFIKNYASAGARASGGAINNNSLAIIGDIIGNFTQNHAESTGGSSAARGGAILNFGSTSKLNGDFTNNNALTNGTFAIGGAIANMYKDSSVYGSIPILSGNFSGNFAQTTGTGSDAFAQGGAIYNASNIDDIKSSTFSNNFVSGASEQTDGGAIWNNGTIGFSGVNVFQNNYKIVNGEKTANDIYNSGTINVAENGSITLNGGVTGNGAINLAQNATLNINDASVSDNTLTLEKDAALAFNVNEINTADTVQSGGKIDSDIKLNADANLKVSTYVEHGSEAGEGSYTFANSVDTANGQWKLTTTIYNSLYNYDTNLNDENNTLNFTFKKKNATEIAQDFGTDKETAEEILALTGGTSDNEQFNQISKAVNQKAQAGDQNLPNELNDLNDNTQGNLEAARSVNDILGKNIANRLNIRQNHNVYGLSGGDFSEYEPEIWANVLYQKAENSGAFDYTADTKGLITAIDGKAGKNLTVGIGYAYQQTDLDSGSKSIDIDTHSVFGYAEYLKNHWFANGLVSYNMSSNNQTKQAFGVNISGDYDTDVLGTQLMAGREFYGCTENHILRLRPQAGLRYYKINQDGYTDSAGMNYNSTDSDVVTGVFGVEISDNTDYRGTKIMPKAFINATYDLKNDDSSMLVKLPNGTAYNVSQESNGKFGIEAGVGVEMAVTDNAKVGVSYEYDWRDDYSAHTGLLNLKYAF